MDVILSDARVSTNSVCCRDLWLFRKGTVAMKCIPTALTLSAVLALSACSMKEPEPPVVDYKSKQRITFKYDPLEYYSPTPAEMLDMAEEYCRSMGKTSMENGTRDTKSWSQTEQYYDFECVRLRAGGSVSNSTLLSQQNNMLLRRILRNQPPPFQ